MSDTNKSGYQLRADMLGMAMSIVSERNHRARESVERELLPAGAPRGTVDPFTTEEIITEAEKLYAFVQKK